MVGVRGRLLGLRERHGQLVPAPHARLRALRGGGTRAAAARAAARTSIYATSPPLTIALPGARWRAARRRAPLVFEVRDLWPEAPIQMGALRNPLAQRAGARRSSGCVYRARAPGDRAVARASATA